MEEIKVRQRERESERERERERDVKEGDKNTTYFHAAANQRRRKAVTALEGSDVMVEENGAMLKLAVDFYKKLFGFEPRLGVKLRDDFLKSEEKVTSSENAALEAPFAEEEIKAAVFESYSDGAPGPNGLPFLFYQKFWEVVKKDLRALFSSFDKEEINLARLNYATIILIPKEPNANNLRKFRPISLLNCSFKIFSKALNNRLIKVCDRLIALNQTAFIKGRFILESVVAAREIIHEVSRKKEKGVILKLDYEKAYDRVSWEFLEETLDSRGFGTKWIHWIRCVVRDGSLCVRLNDEDNHHFKLGKGLRQSDPLSPPPF